MVKRAKVSIAIIIAAELALCIGLSIAFPPSAEAAYSDEVCSLPFIDDVNEWGKGKVILTVTACGDKSIQLKATSQGKRLKVVKHKPRVWTVVVRKGKEVKLSVRPRHGKWRSIGYRVY